MTTTTDNMSLVLGVVSETLGPEWAELINAAFEAVDAHDHTDGNGVKITPAALEINDDLSFGGNKAEDVNGVGLKSQGAADTAFAGSLQRIGTNLWWVNASGAAVQLTSGTSIVSTGSGALSLSSPGAYPYSVVSGDAQKVLAVDTSAARTLNLPAATTSMYFQVKDSTGQAATNNISVVPAGTDVIDGTNTTYTIDANYASVGFISDGVSKWFVV